MRTRRYLQILFVLMVSALLTSCASHPKPYILSAPPPFTLSDSPPLAHTACTSQDLNPLVASGEYVRRVDNFLIITDASSTMADRQVEKLTTSPTKFVLAKEILTCMNQTIPDAGYQGGLRIFGPTVGEMSTLLYGNTNDGNGLVPYVEADLGRAIDGAKEIGGLSPLPSAIDGGALDLQTSAGPTAVIIVSDGKNTSKDDPADTAKAMKQAYGDVCIYTIYMGDDVAGKQVMDSVTQAGQCGFATAAADFASDLAPDQSVLGHPEGMAEFVKTVFLRQDKDSDGDGVRDSLDKCPNTPHGAPVDKDGCPLDSDGDGVYDYLDKCPGTPRGVAVDMDGCPIKEKLTVNLQVEFDFDKAIVKPQYRNEIKRVADFMQKYPETRAILKGHTDNVGTDAYNQNLSERRAASVMQYLIDTFGIDAARLHSQGFGEKEPVATNDTAEGRQKNRRVVTVIFTTVVKKR